MTGRPWALALFVVSLVAASPRLVEAQRGQPTNPRVAMPERPTVATHAHTVAPGYLELETGVQGYHPQSGETEYDTPSLIKIGLTSHIQIDILSGVTDLAQTGQNTLGIGDISTGVKWRLVDRAVVVGDFAVQTTVKFPTGSASKGTGTGTTDLNLVLISSHALGPLLLDVNVGYTKRSGDESIVPNDATMWTASVGFPLRGRAGWTAEVFGYPGTTGPTGKRPMVGFLTGPTYTIRRSLVIDGGAVLRIAGPQATTLFAGLTWNIGRLAPQDEPKACSRQQ